MSEAKLTTTNIGVEKLKSLKRLSAQLGLKQVEFINAAVDYFRKTGIDPTKEIFSPREEIAKMTKRLDEVIGVIKTHERDKLGPLVEQLALFIAQFQEAFSSMVVKEDLRLLEFRYESMIQKLDRIKSLENQTSTGFQDSLKALRQLEEKEKVLAQLLALMFEALKNKSIIGSISEEDKKNFDNALRQVR